MKRITGTSLTPSPVCTTVCFFTYPPQRYMHTLTAPCCTVAGIVTFLVVKPDDAELSAQPIARCYFFWGCVLSSPLKGIPGLGWLFCWPSTWCKRLRNSFFSTLPLRPPPPFLVFFFPIRFPYEVAKSVAHSPSTSSLGNSSCTDLASRCPSAMPSPIQSSQAGPATPQLSSRLEDATLSALCLPRATLPTAQAEEHTLAPIPSRRTPGIPRSATCLNGFAQMPPLVSPPLPTRKLWLNFQHGNYSRAQKVSPLGTGLAVGFSANPSVPSAMARLPPALCFPCFHFSDWKRIRSKKVSLSLFSFLFTLFSPYEPSCEWKINIAGECDSSTCP